MSGNNTNSADLLGIDAAGAENFSDALKIRANALISSLQDGNYGEASELIRQINHTRDETLYYEVGRLTRELHNAIRDFHLDMGLHGNPVVEHELTEMADARDRLNYVIQMTEDAANQTMDNVDEAAPLIQRLVSEGKVVSADWKTFLQAQSKNDGHEGELFTRVDHLLSRLQDEGSGIHSRLTDILMAQGYQDLSGQLIKRVISLVTDVEQSLVRLVKLASNVEVVAGISQNTDTRETKDNNAIGLRAEGPQMNPENKQGVVSNQDDVDELLSSLGF